MNGCYAAQELAAPSMQNYKRLADAVDEGLRDANPATQLRGRGERAASQAMSPVPSRHPARVTSRPTCFVATVSNMLNRPGAGVDRT